MLSQHHIAAIILAAGRGTRMGAEPKLLLPMRDGTPLLKHICISALRLEPSELLVVVRPDLPALAEALAGLPVRVVPNADYQSGMASSLAAGIRALSSSAEAALLLLGDEPAVDSSIVQTVLTGYLAEHKAVTIPVYGGQVGPPAILARALFSALLDLKGDAGVRQLVVRDSGIAHLVSMKESDRPRDIDTPQDYGSFFSGG